MRKYKTPLAILRAARRLISKKEHWLKGNYHDGYACFCAVGAIACVTPDGMFGQAGVKAEEVLARHLPRYANGRKKYDGVISYNDHPKTTHRHVLTLFDRAIKSLEKEKQR